MLNRLTCLEFALDAVILSESKLNVTLLDGEGWGVRYVRTFWQIPRWADGDGAVGCRTVGAEPLLADPLLLERRLFLRTTVPVLTNIDMSGQ